MNFTEALTAYLEPLLTQPKHSSEQALTNDNDDTVGDSVGCFDERQSNCCNDAGDTKFQVNWIGERRCVISLLFLSYSFPRKNIFNICIN